LRGKMVEYLPVWIGKTRVRCPICKNNDPLVYLRNAPNRGLIRFAVMMSRTQRYWLSQAGGWGAYVVLNIFFAFIFEKINDDVFWYRLIIFVGIGISVTHLMRFVIHQSDILLKPLRPQIINFVILTLLFATLAVSLETAILKISGHLWPTYQKNGQPVEVHKVVINNMFIAFLYYFIWNCIYFIYHFIEKSRKQQLDTLHLESLVKELELKTIKAHINPHFIFNSLNSIRALVDENPQRARAAVTELSNILRSSMQSEKLETVPFEKELAIVRDYLALENMRFEDRLRVEYQVDEDTLDQPVPPMMLQTLVENAIKHGISKQINGGVVRVISDFKGDFHELVVQNTGYLNGHASQEGFGLSSTTNRLNLLYGDKAQFDIRQLTPTLVEAKVLIPFDKH
jgi:two-component system LytT family sensor kinase